MRFFWLILLLLSQVTLAKSYTYNDIKQDAFLKNDGSLEMTETRAYNFDGSYSQAFLKIDPRDGATLSNAVVQAVDNLEPVTSQFEANTLTWQFAAINQTRRFELKYRIANELLVASDATKLDRALLEPKHAPVRRYTLRIHAPQENLGLFKVFIFTRNSRIGTMDVNENTGLATVQLENLEQDEWVRAVVLMPTDIFMNAVPTPEPKLDFWMNELRQQTKAFRNASAAALRNGGFAAKETPSLFWLSLPFVLSLGFLIAIVRAYLQKRQPKISRVGKYYREPPEKIPAGVVPYILTVAEPGAEKMSQAIGATLLQLAYEGVLGLKKRTVSNGMFSTRTETDFEILKKPTRGLTEFENEVWHLLDLAANGTKDITSQEIREFLRDNPTWLDDMAKIPRDWYERNHGTLWRHTDKDRPLTAATWAILFGMLFFIIGGIMALFNWNRPMGFAILISSLFNLLLGYYGERALREWKDEKLENAKRWEAYKRYLTEFSAMGSAPAEHLKLWDYHFVYATALGVTKKYLENLKRLARSAPDDFSAPDWLRAYRIASHNDLNFADFLDLTMISRNLKELETALSDNSRSGGGFGGSDLGDATGSDGESGAS